MWEPTFVILLVLVGAKSELDKFDQSISFHPEEVKSTTDSHPCCYNAHIHVYMPDPFYVMVHLGLRKLQLARTEREFPVCFVSLALILEVNQDGLLSCPLPFDFVYVYTCQAYKHLGNGMHLYISI